MPSFITRLLANMSHAREARRTARILSAMSDRDLRDIGITRGDIVAVAWRRDDPTLATRGRAPAPAGASLAG